MPQPVAVRAGRRGPRAGKEEEEEEVGEGRRCMALWVVHRATLAWVVLLLVQNNLVFEYTSLLGDGD